MLPFLKKEPHSGRPPVVVVTGASAGVGRAIAWEFARQQASVGLLARPSQGLDAVVGEVEQLGGRALALPVDTADPRQVEEAAEAVERELGPIDVWVNNAMVSVFSFVADIEAEEFKRVTEVTYLGYVYGTVAALRRMQSRDRGVIIQVGSALAFRGIPLQSAYCGAKHAIEGFTDSLRCELVYQGSNVRVTEVHLPAMNTPQFSWVKSRLARRPQPVPPIYQPEVGARAVVWASTHSRRSILVGWPTFVSVWANKFVPSILDRYLGKTGVDSQQTEEPERPDRQSNLMQSLGEDRGAHGDFDHMAHKKSNLLWFMLNARRIAAGAGLLGLAIALRSSVAGSRD